jgi:hypothetical protein
MSRGLRSVHILAVVSLGAALGQGNKSEPGEIATIKGRAPVKTTLCEIVKTPERFNGKFVQLRTYVVSGPDVPAGLFDRRCPPNDLLDVGRNNTALIESKGYKALQMSLKPSTPIEASMTGVFVNRKVRNGLNTFDSMFELLSITDVIVKTQKEVFEPAARSSGKK